MTAGVKLHDIGYELRLARIGRENVDTKGRRYLLEGRLTIHRVDEHGIRAICRGTETTWELGYSSGRWWCECPARGRCSHLVALQLVTNPRGERFDLEGRALYSDAPAPEEEHG